MSVRLESNFLEHFVSGLTLDVSVAIDFSASSKELHTSDENPYRDALGKIGGISELLDPTSPFPVFTFGSSMMNGSRKNLQDQIFPVCMSLSQKGKPFSSTLSAYDEAVKTLVMKEPTDIHEVISQVG